MKDAFKATMPITSPNTKEKSTPPSPTTLPTTEYLKNMRRSVSSPDMNSRTMEPRVAIPYREVDTGTEEPVVEAMQVESDASEQIRTDDNTGNQFTENRGDF